MALVTATVTIYTELNIKTFMRRRDAWFHENLPRNKTPTHKRKVYTRDTKV